MTKTINMMVEDSSQLRDSLPQSGVFEMTDCIVEVVCSAYRPIIEATKIVDIIKSTINVVEHTFTLDESLESFQVRISEVPPPFSKGRFKK